MSQTVMLKTAVFGSLLLLLVGWVATATADFPTAVSFACSNSEATIAAKNGARVSSGTQTIYIGYQQVSATNKNPIVASFTDGVQDWCRTDYETTGDDNTGYGLIWDGTPDGLYAAFSVTGTQGSSSQDFRRFATNGWLRSYTDGSPGGGGGPKASIVAQIDPATGDVQAATFVTAVLSNGKTNSLTVTDLVLEGSTLRVDAQSFYSPRNPDKSRMECSGSSPFDYTLYLSADLQTAVYATADGCIGNAPQLPTEVTITPAVGFVGHNGYTATVSPVGGDLYTFTWRVNGTIVREQTTASATDHLGYTWPAPANNQTVQVTVNSTGLQAQNQPPVSSNLLTFDVVVGQQLYLPLFP